HFDGSTEDGEVLVVAGYLARADRWLKFWTEWQTELDANGGRPFKMTRAAKTAKGMRRAKRHYEIIERMGLLGIGCAIPIKSLVKVVDELGIDPKLKNPYYVGWRSVITLALEGLKQLRLSDPIQFVFDEQTEKVNIILAWDQFHANAPA